MLLQDHLDRQHDTWPIPDRSMMNLILKIASRRGWRVEETAFSSRRDFLLLLRLSLLSKARVWDGAPLYLFPHQRSDSYCSSFS